MSPAAAGVVERSQEALRTCRYDEAMQLIEANLPTAAPVDRALLQVAAGTVRERRGDLPGAIALYRQAIAADEIPLQAPLVLGLAEVRNQEFAEGHRNLNNYIGAMVKRGHYPSWQAIAAAAVALAELGRVADAHRLLTDAVDTLEYSDQLLLDLRDLAAKSLSQPARKGLFWTTAYGADRAAATAMDTDFTPMPRERVAPQYPRDAARDRVEGDVLVALNIAATGEVLDAKIVKATPSGVFENAVLRAVKQWKFRPASRNCVPLASSGVQKLQFRMAR